MAFGGFGNSNNSTGGFGGFGGSTGSAFGSNNNTTSGSSLFGGNTATSGGFNAFGSNNTANNPFGTNKPAFGAATAATTGGGLFGGGTSTSGAFGSGSTFGASTNTGNAFGSNTGGGIFGQNKPATGGFGSANTGSSLFGNNNNNTNTGSTFGSNNNTSNPFGSTNTNPGFGASNTGSNFAFAGAAPSTNNNGTSATPFTAFTEKDSASNQNQAYQSITFNQPYTNSSFEELRLQDYAQGRRFASSNGQAGSFGTSTGFGGFGSTTNAATGGSLFGGNPTTNNNTSAFGSGSSFGNNANTNANPFGGNTGSSLFGSNQNKPAGATLFGSATTSAPATGGFGSTSNSTGGLFGNANNTNAFGGNNNTGGSLFGNNNQAQNKPAFGGFGSTTNTTNVFGSSNNNTGGSLFGGGNNNTANTNTGGSLFGSNNQQSNPFGGSTTGGGLFGSQAKPAGSSLFGASNTTNTAGGFGTQNNQQQQNNPFGSTNTGGGLFGNQSQNKPAGTGLFGSTPNTNAGGSLFGNNNNQQQTGSSLFGAGAANTGGSLFGNQNKPAGTSLFGGSTANNSGTGLFGSQNNQQQSAGNSLFGGINQNQQNNNSGSLFGGMNQSQQPAPNQLHASLTASPYGNEQLFSSLAAPSPPVGPLATPLSGARPAPKKTQSLLASAKVNTPVYSPRGSSLGRAGGYGFNYSTYGTPGSAFTSGSLTPGASSLLRPTGSLSSALTSRLGKSFSTSNLRADFTPDTPSLLRPGALTPGSRSGSLRRLKIDRSLRTDLFGSESKQIEALKDDEVPSLKKKVSFTRESESTSLPEPSAENALVRTETDVDESPALLRAKPAKTNGAKAPEMEQVNASLSTVPEDHETPRQSSAPASKISTTVAAKSGDVGDYWTKPAMKDLRNMSRQQLQNVGNFTVGRTSVGRIEFGRVDLTNTPLDDICGSIVQLNPRSATVYQDDFDKPSVGKSLNVPSTIYLENSWPRSHGGRKPVTAKGGKEYDKHIARLKRVVGTHFLDYDPETGVWSFTVDHFTTYGLDDDDEDETEYGDGQETVADTSGLSEAPETPTDHFDNTVGSFDMNEQEDTFHFKKMQRSQVSVPGGFGSESMIYDESSADEAMEDDRMISAQPATADLDDPFISGGAVRSPSPDTIEQYHSSIIDDNMVDAVEENDAPLTNDVPGSFAGPESKMLRSILKPSTDLMAFTSPEKLVTTSWEEQLQRTVSPKKRDRQALRDMQQSLLLDTHTTDEMQDSPFKLSLLAQSALGQSYLAEKSAKKTKSQSPGIASGSTHLGKSQAFRTAMDLMDSMYAQEKTVRRPQLSGKGFEYPYPKKAKLSTSDDPKLRDWHENMKPSFATSASIMSYSATGPTPQATGDMVSALQPLVGINKDIRFVKFASFADNNSPTLLAQKEVTGIDTAARFPFARVEGSVALLYFEEHLKAEQPSKQDEHEKNLWKLSSILFDPLETAAKSLVADIPKEQVAPFAERIRADALRSLWVQITAQTAQAGLRQAKGSEERALFLLTAGDREGACRELTSASNFKLATLISQLPGSEQSRAMMKKQISVWRDRNDWAEMSDAIRALYSIIAGEVCTVAGKTGASENRVPEFNLSTKFELSWHQSFALRLFYLGHETVGSIIKAYIEDLEAGKERVAPVRKLDNGMAVPDTLLEILRLSAPEADLAELFNPFYVSGSMVNSRLAWQLATVFDAKGVCKVSSNLLDQLTLGFASELEIAGKPVTSAWVLLYLRDVAVRERAITDLLNRNGNRISTPNLGDDAVEPAVERGSFEHLIEDLGIPSAIVFNAKALWALAGLRNTYLQTNFLLRAGEVEQAHEVLLHSVGPTSVIERDYEVLSATLDLFEKLDLRPAGWDQGGRMYSDFLHLARALKSGKRHERGLPSALKRLKGVLATATNNGTKIALNERVAYSEMEVVVTEFEMELEDGQPRDARMGGMDGSSFIEDRRSGLLVKYQQAMGIMV